jgi:hypothetical protein
MPAAQCCRHSALQLHLLLLLLHLLLLLLLLRMLLLLHLLLLLLHLLLLLLHLLLLHLLLLLLLLLGAAPHCSPASSVSSAFIHFLQLAAPQQHGKRWSPAS